jgi:MFS family permease
MSALDSRSVNVALPTLSVYFDASLAVVQWIPLAYQLTIVGLVLSMARLGDKLGRKRIYPLGFVLLGVGSACCGLSAELWQIIMFRVVEAIGGTLVLANGRAIASALSLLTALSMVGFSQLGADSGQIAVMLSMMLLGLGWSLFQSPNLSGMFNAVALRYVGAVSGLSLTSANIANAMGVAVGSVLFLRWLNYHGLRDSVVPPYTQWSSRRRSLLSPFRIRG